MNLAREIEAIITNAAESFGEMLEHLYPAYGDNGFNERNISFQFAHAFKARFPDANVFMELPLYNGAGGTWSYRVDGYAFNRDIGVFFECKRLYSAEKADQMRYDAAKLTHANIAPTLERLEARQPQAVYALLLADTFVDNIADWWKDGKDDNERWDRQSLIKGCTIGCKRVREYDRWQYNNTLYWLYAHRALTTAKDTTDPMG